MLGAIIGDIAGSTYEVDEVKALKNKEINYENRMRILDKNTHLFNEDSTYTDDTILTAAIASAIMTDNDYYRTLKEFGMREVNLGLDKYGRSRFGKGFCDWLKSNTIGSSYGNGCAMRVSPIANYYNNIETILKETRLSTCTSHNHMDSLNASMSVSMCIYMAKNKKTKEQIKNVIQSSIGYDLNFDLNDLQKSYKFTSKAKDSVPQAIYCFLVSDSFEDAIRKAISIGGDSDTIAAITGSIAEAYYGIDEKLIKEVEKYLPEYIINIVNDFYRQLGKEEPFKNEIKEFLSQKNITKEEFINFVRVMLKCFPISILKEWYNSSSQEKQILTELKILCTEIESEENMLDNILYSLELFKKLDILYKETKELKIGEVKKNILKK